MKFTAHEFAAVKKFAGLEPDSFAAATAVNSTGIDCQGYNEALLIFSLGDFATGADVDFHVEESDELASGYADITGATVSEKAQGTDDNKVFVGRLNLIGRKRYIRVVVDVDDDAVELSVVAVLLDPVNFPATQEQTVAFNV